MSDYSRNYHNLGINLVLHALDCVAAHRRSAGQDEVWLQYSPVAGIIPDRLGVYPGDLPQIIEAVKVGEVRTHKWKFTREGVMCQDNHQ